MWSQCLSGEAGWGSQLFSHLLLPPDSCYVLCRGGAPFERDGAVTWSSKNVPRLTSVQQARHQGACDSQHLNNAIVPTDTDGDTPTHPQTVDQNRPHSILSFWLSTPFHRHNWPRQMLIMHLQVKTPTLMNSLKTQYIGTCHRALTMAWFSASGKIWVNI